MQNSPFYPEKTSVELNPLGGVNTLKYTLDEVIEKPTREDYRLKFAFPPKLEIQPPELKDTVKNILIKMIDAANFKISSTDGKVVVLVPVKVLDDTSLLPDKGKVKIPVMIKLVKLAKGEQPETEFKCTQEIFLLTSPSNAEQAPADGEEPPEETSEEGAEKKEESGEKQEGEAEEEVPADAGTYSGLVAVDYGTSNSSVSVRDPSFAAEEVRGQLSEEQWQSLCEWMNIWLGEHLNSTEPTDLDMFVHNLTLVVPFAEIPECGSPSEEIQESLRRLDDKMRSEILKELIMRLSNYGQDQTHDMKMLSGEMIRGFEAVIDSKNLESQRYFVLELDRNIGPGPISSVLQVLEAPHAEGADIPTLSKETKVDMGARVSLLFHSAALGEIDIRQFVLSSKRFFGSNENLEVLPANGGEVVQVPAEVMARVTYRELFKRSISDIHRRAENGLFQDASWVQTVVSTFPTSYPASLRKTIRDILTDLEIKEIDTRFDEATAAAIYYIWREIGADPVCGMHGLMARSRKDKYNRSYHNILLYDLGGGTTDIALIQLLYEEVKIFKPGEDRGNGGCYFRITPRLLGTTGHRYLGGDLLTLWMFRLMKSKLADMILTLITQKNIEVPIDNPLNSVLMDLPDDITEKQGSGEFESAPRYRPGAFLEWTEHPSQFLRNYTVLNNKVIDLVVPTKFAEDRSKVPNFFTLWEISDEIKKTLGTPIIEHFGTCLGQGLAKNWPEEAEVDSGQIFNLLQMLQPWLVQGGHIKQEDIHMVITQKEMNQVISDTIRQSINLAASLAKARLITVSRRDRIDRLILAGLSCNMKAVQDVAEEVFRASDGIFDYDPANVRFDRDSAKTSVSLGACIGRYMESVRIDPFNEKTRQMLYDGYDQIELVIENLFSYLPCRIAYDSLVAMVPIFEQGQELNCKSFWDKNKTVARSSIKNLRPVQEKFWIYRIDFPGAEPQYLGLVDSEAVAAKNNVEEFRKFREEYVVGFESDAELMIRCFFLPKGVHIIVKEYKEPVEGEPIPHLLGPITKSPLKKLKPEGEEVPEAESEEAEFEQNEPTENEPEENGPADNEAEENENDSAENESEKKTKTEKTAKESAAERFRGLMEADDATLQLNHTLCLKEPLDDLPVIEAGERLAYILEFPDGTTKKCCLSNSLSIRKKYVFKLADEKTEQEPEQTEGTEAPKYDDTKNVIAKFELDDVDEVEEATFVVDEDGRMLMLTKCLFNIDIWDEIEYMQQKIDINYNPFCGQH